MVYWEYRLPTENTALLALVPKRDKPHVVVPGLHILECKLWARAEQMEQEESCRKARKEAEC